MLETALSGLVKIDILKIGGRIFTKLTPVMYYGTEINALKFGVKRSKFKVMVE